ncbi:hypothetical protein [Pseudaestuariivita rosea]|uniref:CIS tube protein n=1 Tax=Pseudaestuariivita rosea TaxID=2763263 RepID=UPI001ABA22AE|nr:hypothetical protein [Pseudaestuariivita rosea]
MERIVFYNELSGDLIECMLNPESMTWRRSAGLRTRTLDQMPIASSAQTDDSLIYTGGGQTEAALELLFDVRTAAPSSFVKGGSARAETGDIREVTTKLWALAESRPENATDPWPQVVRMIWGNWSVPVVVTAVAERLEDFTIDGVARRSWITLGLRRVNERAELTPQRGVDPLHGDAVEAAVAELTSDDIAIAEAPHTSAARSGGLFRIDLLAQQAFGDPRQWRFLAALNGLENPFDPPADRPFVTVVQGDRGER